MLRLYPKHTSSKLFALLLALVVYAHVYTEKERTADFTLQVRTRGLQSNLVLMSDLPPNVRLSLRGTGKELVRFRVRPPEVILDLAEVRPGEVQRIISPGDVLLPAESGVSVQQIYEPKVVTLEVDSLVARSLPVQVSRIGSVPRGFSLKNTIQPEPQQVLVQGARRLVKPLTHLSTEPLNLAGIESSGSHTLRVLHDSTLTIHPQAVSVTVDLIPTEFLTLVVPVVAQGAAGRVIRMLPETGTVQIEGPVEFLQDLEPTQIRLWVEVENLPPGLHRIQPQISLPLAGIQVTAIIPSEFLVDIGP